MCATRVAAVSTTATFNELMSVLDYPMLIVTARAGDERDGCLVGFATQASIDPPRFLVGISDKIDKFARCGWHDGPHGLPILDDCDCWFVGRVVARTSFGDHLGHLLEPVAAAHGAVGELLTFHRARAIPPGHAP